MSKRTTGRAPKAPAVRYCKWVPPGEKPHLIDPKKLVKSTRMQYCCREHNVLARQAQGFYQKMGKLGNEKQAQIKEQTGKIPGYEKRGAVVTRPERARYRNK